jgi:hypothetical protein
MFRIKELMKREGILTFGAPRPGSWPRSSWKQITAVAHETAGYTLWRLYLN